MAKKKKNLTDVNKIQKDINEIKISIYDELEKKVIIEQKIDTFKNQKIAVDKKVSELTKSLNEKRVELASINTPSSSS